MMRGCSVALMLVLLGGCAWFGNDDPCTGPGCDDPAGLLDNRQTKTTWYCYGRPDAEGWACQNTEDPGKITAVTPGGRRGVVRDQSETTDARTETGPPSDSVGTPPLRTLGQPQAATPVSLEPQNEPEAGAAGRKAGEPTATSVSRTRPRRDEETADPTANTVAGTRQVLENPEDYYAVQLIALREQEGVLQYARRNGMSDPLYMRISNGGDHWYILLLGIYPDRAAARSAAEAWTRDRPVEVKPWVRRLGPLQKAARTAMKDA